MRSRSVGPSSSAVARFLRLLHADDRLRWRGRCGRLGLRLHVVGPAAVVRVQALLLDREQPCRDRVQQRAVVRDEQHRSRKRVERSLQRLAALEVEVVGRLVEHEEVRAGRDHERERQPPPLAAGQRDDRLLVRLPAGEKEPSEQGLRLRAG